ncbi:MAG: Gfo/Idh/MocA family oxidoreductase [Candidatus Saliniplasma sp.]
MNIGVIGVGSMGQNHARVLSDLDCLSAVMDSNKELAKSIGIRYDVPFFSDIDKFLRSDLDAVTIATPASTHYEIAEKVIDNGLDLIVEKPIALSSSDARKMVKKASKKDVLLAVGMIERHNPVIATAKTLLDDGDVGEVITLSSKRVSSFPSRVSDMGVIMDLAIHDLDVMRYLSDSDIASVYTSGGPSNHGSEYEDHSNILVQFENGVDGLLEVNWLTPHKVRNLWITCSKEYIEIDYINQTMVMSSSQLLEYDVSNLFDIPLEHNIRRFSVKRQEPLHREMKDFIGSVKNGRKPLVSGEDGLKSLEVAEAALKSLRIGEKIEL